MKERVGSVGLEFGRGGLEGLFRSFDRKMGRIRTERAGSILVCGGKAAVQG